MGGGDRHHRRGRPLPVRSRPPTRPTAGPRSRKYLFNERILLGVFNTLQLTVYSMVIGVVLGVILTVMRLSANPVLSAVAWVFLWIFRGTPVYVQLAFWGLMTTIYQKIPLGVPFGPSFAAVRPAESVVPVRAGRHRSGAQRGGLHGRDRPRRHHRRCPEGQLEASTALGMSWGLAMRRTVLPQAMRVIIPPTGNEVDQPAQDHLAGDRRALRAGRLRHRHP